MEDSKRKIIISNYTNKKSNEAKIQDIPTALWSVVGSNGRCGIFFEFHNMTDEEIEEFDERFNGLNELIRDYIDNNTDIFIPAHEIETAEDLELDLTGIPTWTIENRHGRYAVIFNFDEMNGKAYKEAKKETKIKIDTQIIELHNLILDFQWNNKKLFGYVQNRLFEDARNGRTLVDLMKRKK